MSMYSLSPEPKPTFSLTGPGTSEVVTAQNMATLNPLAPTGREYITGTFSFVLNSNNQTVVTFIPDRVLRKNTTYDVLLLGGSGSLTSNGVVSQANVPMVNSYEWSFTTGTVDLTVPHTWYLPPVSNQALARACGTGIVCDLALSSCSLGKVMMAMGVEAGCGLLVCVLRAGRQAPAVTFRTSGRALGSGRA